MLPPRSSTIIRRALAFGTSIAALATAPCIAQTSAPAKPALMPLPQTLDIQAGTLRLTGPIISTLTGCGSVLAPGALARFERDFVRLTGKFDGGDPVRLTARCLAQDPGPLSLATREGYRLSVSTDGISIEADGEVGVIRALATLRQLVGRDAAGASMPAVRISDFPRFAWRGVMIDTARHFITIPTLKRQIDAMELSKLNVLHLHLSDNEGFRLESFAFPKLTTIASHGQYYTQAEIRDLVRYAADRGIRVVPEIDLPGHSGAILSAYPKLGVAAIDPKDPLAKPKGALNPASEATYRFLEKLLAEMTALFPDHQFHVGGDEVSDVAWKDSAEVEAFKKKHGLSTKLEVESWFHDRLRRILAAKGKTTIGWDEMADSPLPKDVIVQSWRSSNPVSTATAKGHRVIVSSGFYINDLHQADWYYAINLFDPMAYSTMTAAGLAKVRLNPVTAAQVSDGLVAKDVPPLTPEQEKLVIGAEAPLWAETVTDEMLDGRLWPRGLALAERFWSDPSVRDAGNMYARLLPAMDQLRALGLPDEQRRHGMITRLAPDNPEIVEALIGIVAPTRIFANHMDAMIAGKTPELVELTDIASTDGSPARRFGVNVAAYLAGDRSQSPILRVDLNRWIRNEAAFQRVAAGRPLLSKALPTAQNIASLGKLGLAALDAIEGNTPLPADIAASGQTLLAKLKRYDDASMDMAAITAMPQPPAALIILTAADVGRLVDATRSEKSK